MLVLKRKTEEGLRIGEVILTVIETTPDGILVCIDGESQFFMLNNIYTLSNKAQILAKKIKDGKATFVINAPPYMKILRTELNAHSDT